MTVSFSFFPFLPFILHIKIEYGKKRINEDRKKIRQEKHEKTVNKQDKQTNTYKKKHEGKN